MDSTKELPGEEWKPAQTFIVTRRCSSPENPGCWGEYQSSGHGFTKLNTAWLHKCTQCGHEAWFGKQYPTVGHREVDGG
jgi:hypothetical protein